mgnify:CR=1 FL=1
MRKKKALLIITLTGKLEVMKKHFLSLKNKEKI